MIIALIALKAGLVEVVKSTITGSIYWQFAVGDGSSNVLRRNSLPRTRVSTDCGASECFCDELGCDRHSLTYCDTLDRRSNSIDINPTFLDGDRFDLDRGLRSDPAVFNVNSLLPL